MVRSLKPEVVQARTQDASQSFCLGGWMFATSTSMAGMCVGGGPPSLESSQIFVVILHSENLYSSSAQESCMLPLQLASSCNSEGFKGLRGQAQSKAELGRQQELGSPTFKHPHWGPLFAHD